MPIGKYCFEFYLTLQVPQNEVFHIQIRSIKLYQPISYYLGLIASPRVELLGLDHPILNLGEFCCFG